MKHRNFNRCEREAIPVIKKVIKGILMTILGIAVAALVGFLTMWLWNKLVTDIFDLRSIKYFEAVGLFILAKIFFGGFGGGNGDDSKCSPRKEIGKEIGKEIDAEIDKELKLDLEEDENKNNEEYEKAYEDWWQKKGEMSFNEYMKDKEN